MLNKNFTQKGSMMVEALAMLGLIAMVTPVLYRKASERANELQDINVASQIRLISQAVDSYIQDNKTDFDSNSENHMLLSEAQLESVMHYLPQGFGLNSRLFEGFEIGVNRQNLGTDARPKYSYTSAVLAKLRNDMTPARAAKIATIIGIAGGLYDGGSFNGAQGAWETNPNDFGMEEESMANVRDNSIVAISNEAINKVVGEVDTGQVLYRVSMPEIPNANTMEVDLDMGDHNITNAGNIASQSVDVSEALSANTATISGLLSAGAADIAGITIDNAGINASGKKITAGTIEANSGVIAGITINNEGIDASGKSITAATAGFTGKVTAGSADIAGINIYSEGIEASGKKITAASGVFDYLELNGDLDMKNHDIKNVDEITANSGIFKQVTATGGTFDNLHAHNSLSVGGNDDTDGYNRYLYVGSGATDTNTTLFVNQSGIQVNSNGKNLAFNQSGLNIVTGTHTTGEGENVQTTHPNYMRFDNDFELKSDNTTIDTNEMTITTGDDNKMQYSAGNLAIGGSGVNAAAGVVGSYSESGGTYSYNGNNVFISRNGVIQLIAPAGNGSDGDTHGYIQARRLLSDREYGVYSLGEDNAFAPLNASGSGGTAVSGYNYYQVNPAYTSVMNDIKLASRGGSRLSDILPDYINKGIYIAENTLSDLGFNWNEWASASNRNTFYTYANPNNSTNICSPNELNCVTSPWLGFVPAPQCPPAYDKVITIEPFRWKMSQIYRISNEPRVLENIDNTGTKYDGNDIFPYTGNTNTGMEFSTIFTNDNANIINTLTGMTAGSYYQDNYGITESEGNSPVINKAPVYFQTNTWLNTSMLQHNDNGYPRGWSVIMGFLYHIGDDQREGEYCDIYKKINHINSCSGAAWNLFPVFNKETAAVVRVYCSFNRFKRDDTPEGGYWTWGTNSSGSSSPVYEYDQLHELEGENGVSGFFAKDPYAKNDAWVTQVNDPSLPYNDAW